MAAPSTATVARKSARAAVTKDSTKKLASEAPTAKANKADKKKTRVHPPYYEMIKEAIMALKERTGSSQYAIAKFIEENQIDLPPNFKKLLLIQLKKFVASGKLTKVKNSFKLSTVTKPTSDATEKPKKEPSKKVTTGKKPTIATTGKTKKAAPATKDAAKKVASKGVEEKGRKRKAVTSAPKMKKTPVKKPKSIKSPTKKLKK